MGSWSRRASLALFVTLALGVPAAAAPAGKFRKIYIVAAVPEGTGGVFITGNDSTLGPWNPSGALMYRDGNRRIYALEAPEGFVFEYKFTLGSWETEALGADGKPMTQNYRITVGSQQVYQHSIPGFQHR
jgi:hypothetical protein